MQEYSWFGCDYFSNGWVTLQYSHPKLGCRVIPERKFGSIEDTCMSCDPSSPQWPSIFEANRMKSQVPVVICCLLLLLTKLLKFQHVPCAYHTQVMVEQSMDHTSGFTKSASGWWSAVVTPKNGMWSALGISDIFFRGYQIQIGRCRQKDIQWQCWECVPRQYCVGRGSEVVLELVSPISPPSPIWHAPVKVVPGFANMWIPAARQRTSPGGKPLALELEIWEGLTNSTRDWNTEWCCACFFSCHSGFDSWYPLFALPFGITGVPFGFASVHHQFEPLLGPLLPIIFKGVWRESFNRCHQDLQYLWGALCWIGYLSQCHHFRLRLHPRQSPWVVICCHGMKYHQDSLKWGRKDDTQKPCDPLHPIGCFEVWQLSVEAKRPRSDQPQAAMMKEIFNRGPISCGIDAGPLLKYTSGIARCGNNFFFELMSFIIYSRDLKGGQGSIRIALLLSLFNFQHCNNIAIHCPPQNHYRSIWQILGT